MLTTSKSITLNGKSEVTIDNRPVPIVSMTASIGNNGNLSMSKNVLDAILYVANREQAVTDMKAFDELAYQLASDAAIEVESKQLDNES